MTKQALMQLGKNVYQSKCVVCHRSKGQGMPPAFPAIKGSKVANGPEAEHIKTVLNGRKNTAMQAFRHQLSNKEIAAVVTYQRNSWGNKGGIVQPEQVKKLRK